eukprot:TRINITY_DN105628_c0_g1_i1.p4 TRINITY_DN105628_c0_g1~~TRINITY_DN105628_c0_g1_i1.p4  ORF type:complete len:114 (+),score=20.30 TRINITY_DN105628_c0_g1_i1:922-1263(+)
MHGTASNLLMDLKKDVKILKEQIATMQKMLTEQTEDVTKGLTPKLVQSMTVLQEEIQKERKENAKLEYQVNELIEEKKRMVELTQAFFDRVQFLNDFIGGQLLSSCAMHEICY